MAKIIQTPFLLKGNIIHNRLYPKKNFFSYQSTYILFPLSKINLLKKPIFSLNSFNLFSFYNSDHANKKLVSIQKWIYQILRDNKIDNVKDVILLTHPRVLGYVFNPVSFWLCFNQNNHLVAVLSQVNNTFKQTHSYLSFKKNLAPIKPNDWLEANKVFYVSPFMRIEGKYKFRFAIYDQNINIFINYLVNDKLKLSTALKCRLVKFSIKNLLLSFAKMPFFTLKTIILIYYQAIKLYCKSIKYYQRVRPLDKNTTLGKHE